MDYLKREQHPMEGTKVSHMGCFYMHYYYVKM